MWFMIGLQHDTIRYDVFSRAFKSWRV